MKLISLVEFNAMVLINIFFEVKKYFKGDSKLIVWYGIVEL